MSKLPITYIMAGAMRGPDVPPSDKIPQAVNDIWTNLKYHLTARLRAVCFQEYECLGLYNPNPMTEGDLKSVIQWASKLCDLRQPQLFHYLSHTNDALGEINNHRSVPYTDPFGEYLSPLLEALLIITHRILTEDWRG